MTGEPPTSSHITGGEREPEEGFAQRLEILVDRAGSVTELARRARISRRMITKYRAGSRPSSHYLRALAKAVGVSAGWLETGEGPMLAPNGGAPDVDQAHELVEPPSPGYIALPRYDVRASAGAGAPVLSEDVVEWVHFQTTWLRQTLGVNPSQLALIEASGDSMAPGIQHGDILLVDVGQPVLKGDGIYVLAVDDERFGLVVKRVEITPRGGLVISSDNQEAGYGRYEIAPGESSEVRIVGRVVWTGGPI